MEKIRIRPIQIDDSEDIVKWRNEEGVKVYLFSQEKITTTKHMQWMENVINTKKAYQFIIEEIEGAEVKKIGTTFLKNIDHNNKKAEYGIFIGDETVRGKGYGTIATKQTLKYGFEMLKLNRIYSYILQNNIASFYALTRGGMKQEGILKEDYIRNDEVYDVIIVANTRNEWKIDP